MAISSGRQVIGTTRQIVDGVSPNPSRLHIHNMDNAEDIFLGNETVTTQKVKVVSYSPETKVLLVKGPVPGKPGAQLKIKAYGIKAWNFKNKALAAK